MAEYIERTEELKPCPFCGHKGAEITVDENEYLFLRYSVQCQQCGAVSGRGRTKKSASEAWNRREVPMEPAGDFAPVRHGRWLTWEENFPGRKPSRNSGLGVFCNRCCNHADNMSDYCPNCGAKMDGGSDNDRHLHGERSDGETVLGV